MRIINLTLFLFLFTSGLIAQSTFRGMTWGDSISELQRTPLDSEWAEYSEGGIDFHVTTDYLNGYEVMVIYGFDLDKLCFGGYIFTIDRYSDNQYHDDFVVISDLLNKKYDMEREEKWNDTSFKNNPNQIGFALRMGHVEITEIHKNDITSIIHVLSSNQQGGILHMLNYWSTEYKDKILDSELEDF